MSVRKLLVASALLSGLVAGASPALAGQGGGGGATTCRKNCTSTGSDTAAPSVAVTSPASGSTIASSATVTGTAADNSAVASVALQVDGGTWRTASGTSSWTASLTGLSAGDHTLTARATDAAGNSGTSSITVTVATSGGTTSGRDIVLDDPNALYGLRQVGRGRSAAWGSVSGLLYWEESTTRRGMFFRDSTSGASSYVTLPSDTRTGWSAVSYTMTSATDLWVFGGAGPVVLRHFALTGGTVPTSASLVTSETFGDTDSRPGDLLRLASGAVAASWAQQGSVGPQGLWLVHRTDSATKVLGPLQFMPSKSTNQSLAQHPADGSVWLFNDPDAWGSIGAARLLESSSGLTVSWSDPYWIDGKKYGTNRPDPENPDLTAVADAGTGQIVLAYQSATRKTFQTSPTVLIGSYPIVARVPASGAPSFTTLPVYVERVSDLGLSLAGGSVWLAHHPVDQATMTFDRLQLVSLAGGSWSAPVSLGTTRTAGEWTTASSTGAEFAAGMSDGSLHLFRPTA